MTRTDFIVIGVNGWAGPKVKDFHERLGECTGAGMESTGVDNWRLYGRGGHGIENVTFFLGFFLAKQGLLRGVHHLHGQWSQGGLCHVQYCIYKFSILMRNYDKAAWMECKIHNNEHGT